MLYLLFSHDGHWDILTQLEQNNDVDAIVAAVARISEPWRAVGVAKDPSVTHWYAENRFSHEMKMANNRSDAMALSEALNSGTMP